MNRIKALLPGTTVVQKLNQGSPRNMGVLCFGCPFWANKKVQGQLMRKD